MARRRKNDKDLETIAGAILVLIVLSFIHAWNNYRTQLFIFGAVILIIAVAGIYFAYKLKKKRFDNWYSGKDLLTRLRGMQPNEFEEYIADLYRRLGYKTEKIGGSHDGGIDVTATKDGIKHYIQCKKHITSQAGSPDIRNFAGALMDKLAAGKGIFITTNVFTTEAEQYAKDKPIELIDGDALLRLIRQTGKDKEVITTNKENIKCPRCGGALVVRTAKRGQNVGKQFYACGNFPNCKFTKDF